MRSLISKATRRASIDSLQSDESHGTGLKRVLTARDLFIAGYGCIIGAGIFVLTGVAAGKYAGPGIMISFAIAGGLCALVALAYAELASMIPVAGSAYTYARASMGEFIAFLIGSDLILEYMVGSSGIAVGWSGYMHAVLKSVGLELPGWLSHAPESIPWTHVGVCVASYLACGYLVNKARRDSNDTSSVIASAYHGVKSCNFTWLAAAATLAVGIVATVYTLPALGSIDLLAVLIVLGINALLIVGVKMAARATMILVVLQTLVIILFVGLGASHIDPGNYSDFMPFGWSGIITGAGIVFFAFIGFESVTTLAEECKNPQRDLPRGILGSLAICTVLYLLMAAVMTGAAHYSLLKTKAPVTTVLEHIGSTWAIPIVSVGVLAGLTSTLLVMLLGQSRVLMRMSKDGLVPKPLGEISPRFQTPARAVVILGSLVALCAGMLPIEELAELCNIGTLAAFFVVCVGVIVLRYREPDKPRKFRCPLMPWLPGIGAIACVGLMLSLPSHTWIRFLGWMGVSVAFWVFYSSKHSTLNEETPSS